MFLQVGLLTCSQKESHMKIHESVSLQELLVSSLAQTDALAKLLIERGLITREEFMQKISEERGAYQRLLQRRIAN
jgi:hypothetical protein